MACGQHPDVDEGLRRCDGCGGSFCVLCIAPVEERALCPACRADGAPQELEDVAAPLPAGGDPGLPHWERRSQLGLVAAFLRTCREVCLDTPRFARRLDIPSRWADAAVFGLVVSLFAGIVGWCWSMAWNSVLFGVMSQNSRGGLPAGQMVGLQAAMGAVGVAFVPLAFAVGALVVPALTHLGFSVLNVRTASFGQTLRLYCYTRAPALLALVPFVGGYAGFLWSFVAFVIGLSHLHRTTGGKAFLAAAWWILALIALGCAGLFVALAVIWANR